MRVKVVLYVQRIHLDRVKVVLYVQGIHLDPGESCLVRTGNSILSKPRNSFASRSCDSLIKIK